uniref:Importin-7/11-like TPR repeats domain-containing protein n=1 Tax=Hucho hucho TaxID=62062 RepID=A0A4W5NVK4_9TELE
MGQLLGGVIEMWVDRMDSITQPERRKLSSLALHDLASWNSPFLLLQIKPPPEEILFRPRIPRCQLM